MKAASSPQLEAILASPTGRKVLGDVLANRKYDQLIEANGKTYRVVPLSRLSRSEMYASKPSSSKKTESLSQ